MQKIRNNIIYYKNNFIEPIMENGKYLCPWCKVEPNRIVKSQTVNNTITFYKQCQSCNGIIKIVRTLENM